MDFEAWFRALIERIQSRALDNYAVALGPLARALQVFLDELWADGYPPNWRARYAAFIAEQEIPYELDPASIREVEAEIERLASPATESIAPQAPLIAVTASVATSTPETDRESGIASATPTQISDASSAVDPGSSVSASPNQPPSTRDQIASALDRGGPSQGAPETGPRDVAGGTPPLSDPPPTAEPSDEKPHGNSLDAPAPQTTAPPVFSDGRVSWTATRPRGTGYTYDVIQRTDINWQRVRVGGDQRAIGLTNAEAARRFGLAPELDDGFSATLHHVGQDARGPLVEASRRYHGVGRTGNDSIHSTYDSGNPHPTRPVDRRAFDVDTREYWRWRAPSE